MTRREFSMTLAGSVALPAFASGDRSQVVILTAIAGAHLPATLSIATDSPEKMREGLWELRTYCGASPELESYFAGVFPRAGIHLVQQRIEGEDLTCLIPFDDLAARERAWTAVNADPAWIHARTQFRSYHFGLYRVL